MDACGDVCRYLSLHHREKDSNFCLFMPLFDALGGTLNPKSWQLQKEVDLGITYSLYSKISQSTSSQKKKTIYYQIGYNVVLQFRQRVYP